MSGSAGFSEGILSGYLTLPIETQVFIAAITLLALWFHLTFGTKAVTHGPTILTTMGIFATFFGIAQGLAHFDTTNLQTGVPSLLSGLKTAFWASLVGVGWALSIKVRDYTMGHKSDLAGSNESEEVTAADMVAQLRAIQFALVGGDEGSLITQVKLSRQDSNDRLDALKNAQMEALSKLSDMSSKTLVEALRDVIKDFNQRITDQFGDNFKQLNDAVGKLLVWQEQYKRLIETAVVQLDSVATTTSKAANDYSTIVQRSEHFSEIAAALGLTIESFKSEKQQLLTVSEQLAKLLQSASGSLPDIEKKLLQLTNDLSNAVTTNQQTINESLNNASRSISEITNKTREQVSQLDRALSEELEKSLNGLGTQLATLSSRFVSDYGPLTDNLRHLVQSLGRPLQ